ncbi:alpha/beta fold hydrolase [Pelagibius litoralis]|uniref:Alpha/beta fold hydrolase n=1 Tax=Pelagibius litoralis TaxID=374515 RepID=A0A967KDD3_9PROT|nr:alpha/beta fold hydrolase [Pelagibius litoralis]NIA71354.1 alpha/beta fold hydrolase [Pelagibius litoralis]
MKDPNATEVAGHASQSASVTRKADRPLRRHLASITGGSSPASTLTMINDWALHLASAPDLQITLAQTSYAHWVAWLGFVARGCPESPDQHPIAAQKGDRRFQNAAWTKPPYAAMAQGFLLLEDFFDKATSEVPGLDPAHDRAMTFLMRQMLDAMAPSNFLATNPEALVRTVETHGANLQKGIAAFLNDYQAGWKGATPARTQQLGLDVACTLGKVVFRNHLIELIQYAPKTGKVHPEPILIAPAWIMKYYILDLSPDNSLVRYLTSQGFTVFMISWRNPDPEDATLGMDDYLTQGLLAAVDYITTVTGAEQIHSAGYCLGGTLLSIAAAALARDGDERLASMTLFAAQTDFTEPGELSLFINESQVSFLEDLMDAQGYLEANQMMGAFQMLRSNDLIWSRVVRSYLLSENDTPMNDLMAWNADGTRMPARMHSEYLRHMFLNNDLAAGRYQVGGHAVSLRDIRIPVFGVGTETDHIAPWKSVFKVHSLGHADVTFVLTNGGHNAGVLSEPGHKHRHFRVHTTRDQDNALSPEDWLETAALEEGSWWPSWAAWLSRHSGPKGAPPKMGRKLADAPGTYVMME